MVRSWLLHPPPLPAHHNGLNNLFFCDHFTTQCQTTIKIQEIKTLNIYHLPSWYFPLGVCADLFAGFIIVLCHCLDSVFIKFSRFTFSTGSTLFLTSVILLFFLSDIGCIPSSAMMVNMAVFLWLIFYCLLVVSSSLQTPTQLPSSTWSIAVDALILHRPVFCLCV